MNKFCKICCRITASIVTIAFMFIPESAFQQVRIIPCASNEVNIIINRIALTIIVLIVSMIITATYLKVMNKIVIKGKNYIIQVEYGDLMKIENCQRVISFDECYTTKIGNAPSEIKPTSICGQYLKNNPNIDMNKIITDNNVKPANSKSKFENKTKYDSGTIIPNGNDLLLSFAKLDENGKGTFFNYREYLNCLEKMWQEIDKYFAQKDVCIPILGAGLTRIRENTLTQQELLEIIIKSYQLHNYKIKKPYKLRIICRRSEDISLNRINENAI